MCPDLHLGAETLRETELRWVHEAQPACLVGRIPSYPSMAASQSDQDTLPGGIWGSY